MNQFVFNLELINSFNESDFFVNQTNKKAVDLISLWPNWHNKAAILYGERKSGKTHLGNIWMNKSKAKFIDIRKQVFEYESLANKNYLIDNFSYIKHDQENYILDIFNQCLFNNNFILFLCDSNKKINFKLNDLKSRFNSILSTSIDQPNDQLIEVIVSKFFSDNQVLISKDVIKYLSNRLDRSYSEINFLLEKINDISFKEKQRITIPFLRQHFFN